MISEPLQERCKRAIIVGNTDGILREIAEPLARSGVRVTALIPEGDQLWNSRIVTDRYLIPDIEGDELVGYLTSKKWSMELEGWYFWNSQATMRAIFRSGLTEETKSRLLNGIDLKHGSIIGSRVNQALLFDELKLNHPKSKVIETEEELKMLALDGPLIYKTDIGGAGHGIGYYTDISVREILDQNRVSLPILVQQKIEGVTVHVETFFDSGELIAWAYSKNVGEGTKFGYVPVREYCTPRDLSFLEILRRIGRHLSISGPAGAAFIVGDDGDHRIIEFDINVGLWHHLLLKRFRQLRRYDPVRSFESAVLEENWFRASWILLRLPSRKLGASMPSVFFKPKRRFRYLKWMIYRLLQFR
jgi:hypothetical protein